MLLFAIGLSVATAGSPVQTDEPLTIVSSAPITYEYENVEVLPNDVSANVYKEVSVKPIEKTPVKETKPKKKKSKKPKKETEVKKDPYHGLTKAEVELIAIVTMAEAEGECEKGKRLVIDTILNRVDSEHFPDNVYDVIYQKNQFTSMWNGRAKRCYVKDDIFDLVLEELEKRTNKDVMFFCAGRYGDYGTPMFQVGGHYFSRYN